MKLPLVSLFVVVVAFFSAILFLQSFILPHHLDSHSTAHSNFLGAVSFDLSLDKKSQQNNDDDIHHHIVVEEEEEGEEFAAKKPHITNTDPSDPFYDKEKIMDMLREMEVDPYSIDNATWAKVPTWGFVTNIWGTEPVVHGLDQHCDTFRRIDPKRRRIAVAGMFSTGTNLLAQLLQHNCGIPERIEWLGRNKGHGMGECVCVWVL